MFDTTGESRKDSHISEKRKSELEIGESDEVSVNITFEHDGEKEIEKSFTFERNLEGVILGIWNDRLLPDERSIILQNGLYPNMLAIAERAWRGGGFEYFDRNGVILPDEHSEPFRAFADFERRMLWHKAHYFKGYPFPYVRQTHVKWTVTDAFPNEGDLSKRFPPEEEIQTTYEYEGKT